MLRQAAGYEAFDVYFSFRNGLSLLFSDTDFQRRFDVFKLSSFGIAGRIKIDFNPICPQKHPVL
jgi:hypothetical protein